jgi:ubiquinol-cytochrome c reductase cytochrome b subunit
MVFAAIVFFAPEMGGYFLEANNFIPADPLANTCTHCASLVFHAVLFNLACSAPNRYSQFPGVLAMGLSVVAFAFLPWLDKSPVKSIRYRGTLYKAWLAAFVIEFLILGYLGTVPSNAWGQFGAVDGWCRSCNCVGAYFQ